MYNNGLQCQIPYFLHFKNSSIGRFKNALQCEPSRFLRYISERSCLLQRNGKQSSSIPKSAISPRVTVPSGSSPAKDGTQSPLDLRRRRRQVASKPQRAHRLQSSKNRQMPAQDLLHRSHQAQRRRYIDR
ncbi:hypothetical protein M8818_007402 [Zalaria obscura]|uniref:Uncharacterized protein n=1 Tax=Zalaria obscura TaxID=2024903 RepID=A0ACC3S3L0_9PEZI